MKRGVPLREAGLPARACETPIGTLGLIGSNAGLREIRWTCDPSRIHDQTPAEAVFRFPNGLADFLGERIKDIETVTPEPFAGRYARPGEGRSFWLEVLEADASVQEVFTAKVNKSTWEALDRFERLDYLQKEVDERTARVAAERTATRIKLEGLHATRVRVLFSEEMLPPKPEVLLQWQQKTARRKVERGLGERLGVVAKLEQAQARILAYAVASDGARFNEQVLRGVDEITEQGARRRAAARTAPEQHELADGFTLDEHRVVRTAHRCQRVADRHHGGMHARAHRAV